MAAVKEDCCCLPAIMVSHWDLAGSYTHICSHRNTVAVDQIIWFNITQKYVLFAAANTNWVVTGHLFWNRTLTETLSSPYLPSLFFTQCDVEHFNCYGCHQAQWHLLQPGLACLTHAHTHTHTDGWWCCSGAGFQLIPNRRGWTGWRNSARLFWTCTRGTKPQQPEQKVSSRIRPAAGTWGRAYCNRTTGFDDVRAAGDTLHLQRVCFRYLMLHSFLISTLSFISF